MESMIHAAYFPRHYLMHMFVVNAYLRLFFSVAGLACLKSKDLEWFFFCSLDGKYETGQRVKRSNEFGFWKTTGNDKRIVFKSRTVGWRKTLIFYEGKKPGTRSRSNWTMHEYRLDDKELPDASNYQVTISF